MVNSRIHLQQLMFALAFFVLPFLTFILSKVLFENFSVNLIPLNQELFDFTTPISKTAKLNEIIARLLWVTSVMVYFFVNTGFSIFVWKCLKEIKTSFIPFVFFTIAFLFSSIETSYLIVVEPTSSPIASIFHVTFNALHDSGLFHEQQLSAINTILNIVNIIGFMIVPFGIVAGCSIMFDISIQTKTDPEYFLGRLEQIKKLTTGGSAIMVVGVIHMQLWLSWPMSFSENPELTTIMKSIVLSVCQYWGVCYSLIIAAVYLPAASYLAQQAKKSIAASQHTHHSEQWLVDHKMVYSIQSSLPQIIAVIAPMLAGTFGSSIHGLSVI